MFNNYSDFSGFLKEKHGEKGEDLTIHGYRELKTIVNNMTTEQQFNLVIPFLDNNAIFSKRIAQVGLNE